MLLVGFYAEGVLAKDETPKVVIAEEITYAQIDPTGYNEFTAPWPAIQEPSLQDRTECSEIRGTEYLSSTERVFFLENCARAYQQASVSNTPVIEVPVRRQTTQLVAPIVSVSNHLQRIKNCESGGYYAINTGNGFYGGYQFDLQTWGGVGGTGLPSDASPEEQDMRATMLYEQRGGAPWPVCQYR